MVRPFFLTFLLISSSTFASEQIVWHIGVPDKNYAEFAFAGNWQAYAKQSATMSAVFEVGKSDPARDWPFIQAGSTDHWTPMGGKPRIIRFDLPEEPRGVYTLRVRFVDVQISVPPRFVVAVGEHTGVFALRPGKGREQSLRDARFGWPQEVDVTVPHWFLRKGSNEIRLTCSEGSWVLYDSVTLTCDAQGKLAAAEIRGVTAQAEPVYLRCKEGIHRVVKATLALSAPAEDMSLRVEAAGRASEVSARSVLLFDSIPATLEVPDVPGPTQVKITATAAGRTVTKTVAVAAARKWRLYVAASAHTDIGYTDLQQKCAERHNENTDAAIDILYHDPDFRWNLEVAWQAENYIHARSGQRLADFYRYAREGKIGIQALYCNMLTGLCSPEEACRLTWFAHKLCRQQGIPYRSAMISDVPSQEASLPMILAGCGIRYFSSGVNHDRAYPFGALERKSPCWWEGPDGSRVLMVYAHDYAHAMRWGLTDSFDMATTRIFANLGQYQSRDDYPYDAIFLHGAIIDNGRLDARMADIARQWNQRYEYPRILLSHNADFFEYIEKHYGDKLPVVRGSAGTYWEDGAASSARETALCRQAHETLGTGERMAALADAAGARGAYGAEQIDATWRNCMLFDEHTWGAHCSITQPESEFTKAQWRVKSQFAVDAAKGADDVLHKGAAALASLVRSEGPALVVFNPTSWPRTDLVRARLPAAVTVVEPGVASYTWRGDTFWLVRDIPPCGYRVLRLGPAATKPAAAEPCEGHGIESRFYRVEFDPGSGGITSIRDKQLGRELVDAKAPFRLNQYVYVAGGSDNTRIVQEPRNPLPELTISGSGKATLRRTRLPGLGEMMTVETSGTMAPSIASTVLVWDDIQRIDFINRLTKKLTYDKEAVYFAFPFALERPTFRYEAPAAIVNANQDMLPGACRNWFTVQHFVEMEGRGAAIAWATPDAPVVCFQDINRGQWLSELRMSSGHLFAYVMNNYWFTNYLAGQGGDFTFRFSLTSRPKADSVASARFGWAASSPLVAVPVQANPRGPLPPQATSLVSVDEPGVAVISVKRADKLEGSAERRGLVVRLWELTGRATTAHLRLDRHISAQKAAACNLVEDPQGPLEIRDGVVQVPLRGSGLSTVRIE